MREIQITELSEAFQRALAEAGDDESIVIKDASGQALYGIIPYRKPTAEQKERAWERMREFQEKAEASMKKHGVTEDDVMREILKDD